MQGLAVIYIVEDDAKQTIDLMVESGIKAHQHVKSQALTIIDRNAFYLSSVGGFNLNTLDQIKELHASLNAKFRGVSIVGMPVFPSSPDISYYHSLISYEKRADEVLQVNDECICCYTCESILKLPLTHIIHLINSHQYFIRENVTSYHSTNGFVMSLIKKALGKFFEEELLVDLIFKTLKLIYHIDEEFIVNHPDVFEGTIKKMFKSSSEALLNAISDEIRAAIILQGNEIKVNSK